MKTLIAAFLFFIFIKEKPIVGNRLPVFTGTTLKGTKIDSTYFKGKTTFITFMYIGCPPCMQEINALQKLKTRPDFQILVIAPHTADQLKAFISSDKSIYSEIRDYFGIKSVPFEMLPECVKYKGWKNQQSAPGM